jgi:hypothetical protein
MTRRAWLPSVLLAVASGGCAIDDLPSWLHPDSSLDTVHANPFAAAPAGPLPNVAHAPATEAVARRVNDLGQRVLAANPDLPIRPVFVAIGSPDPEIFHRDTTALFISEGLANRCATEAQLAAVLCSELGKMMSQREALLALKARRPDRDAPVAMPIGSDGGGTFGAADAVRLAELGKFDETRRAAGGGPPPAPPDAQLLARTYMARAGYTGADLEAAAPLLREADKHNEQEKQFTTGPIRPFVVP